MSKESQLIQPLISTEAFSRLRALVPSTGECEPSTSPLNGRQHALSHSQQVFLTALPLIVADLVAISASYLVASLLLKVSVGSPIGRGVLNNVSALCLSHLLMGQLAGLFPATGMNPVKELRALLTSVTASFVLLIALNGLLGEVTWNEIATIPLAALLAALIVPVARFSTRRKVASAKWWGESVIIVGTGEHGRSVLRFLSKHQQRGLKPLGVVDDHPNDYWMDPTGESIDFLGPTSDLVQICRERNCHWVIAAIADKSEEEVVRILTRGSLVPNLVVLNNTMMMPTIWVESFDAAGLAGTHVRDRLLFPFQRLTKRAFDVVLSSVGLVVSLPLLIVIAAIVKMLSPGPVFYKHHGRIGRNGVRFGAHKIRTMVTNSEQILREHLTANPEAAAEWQRDLKLKNDPRIIRGIGHFLRKTSLDELPQLWNILVGEMSFVGPRPIYTQIEVDKFQEQYPLYLRVRPGLTGLWQVSGRNNTSYEDRVRLDAYYVRNWSLWLDYFILLRTVRTVLFREGSY